MPDDAETTAVSWNSSELRAGVDKWLVVQATVTEIDQPFHDQKFGFLSVITYTFKDASGEYFAGKYQTPTDQLPAHMTEGSTITIRYNPNNPDKSWCADDYYRAGFGRFQTFDYPITMVVLVLGLLLLVAMIEIFHIRVR
jgi:hypothetical protein